MRVVGNTQSRAACDVSQGRSSTFEFTYLRVLVAQDSRKGGRNALWRNGEIAGFFKIDHGANAGCNNSAIGKNVLR